MKTSTVHRYRNIYLKDIEDSFEVLKDLKIDGFYSIPKMKRWILKYEDLYEYSYNHRHVNSCIEGMGCCGTGKTLENKFNSLYSSLKEVIDLHRNENYFEEEINTFESLNDDYPGIIEWIKKNETLGSWDYLLFWLEWVEEEKGIVNPFIINWQDEFIFKAEEWKNTIVFCKIFNEIYWTFGTRED